ncbi:pentapeptide repeat-containing protein [Rothia dentocariosa]|uniref:pentapeptide repeat-containing protein n=1 Tax=Rothia dentocariosa TaxID=2047 RepID=UPI0006600422|nr:pentapeptide repeat-containing protein [Rothia dentocariosa]
MDDHRLNAESRIQSITEPPLLEPSKPRIARPIAWSILICAILCVIAAIIIPFLTKQTTLSLVLYAIGGVLTVLALIVFTRRNRPSVATVAHKSVDIFGVTRAERESIYQQATAQLEDQNAKTRQKSLYTFLALVDKCLEDETLSYEDRNKEGQRIVNKISGYIQSPPIFDPHALEFAHGAFHAKSSLLREEAELRFGLMQQIRDRLRAPSDAGGYQDGPWTNFEYDFSGSTFFYPIEFSRVFFNKTADFSGCTYMHEADFSGTIYRNWADFRGSTYLAHANFSGSSYHGAASLNDSVYRSTADFSGSLYLDQANFSGSTYHEAATFVNSTYRNWAVFRNSTYLGSADFSGSVYHNQANFHNSLYTGAVTFNNSVYHNQANFHNSVYTRVASFGDCTYHRADFSGSVYTDDVHFNNCRYGGDVYFRRSVYNGWADFQGSVYSKWANYTSSLYYGLAGFQNSTYADKALFRGSVYDNAVTFQGSVFTGAAPAFMNVEAWAQYISFFAPAENVFSLGQGYAIDTGASGLPSECPPLAVEHRQYLAHKNDELHEITQHIHGDDARSTDKLGLTKELSGRLKSTVEELHAWREKITTIPLQEQDRQQVGV